MDVTIITAWKRDIPIYSSFKNYFLFRKILKNGGNIYQVMDRYLHMKLYSCDDVMFSLGSFNNDKWSWGINKELNAVIEDNPKETKKLMNIIQDRVIQKGLKVNLK